MEIALQIRSLFGQQTPSVSRHFKYTSFDLMTACILKPFLRPFAEVETDPRRSDNFRNLLCLNWATRPPVTETSYVYSFATQCINHRWTVPIGCADETHGIAAGGSRKRLRQCLHIRRPLGKADTTDTITGIPPHRIRIRRHREIPFCPD